ncbi:MAG: epoxyqueuosine reductase QueH [Ruminococcaceae bacterium]|nr:epoxyqueuosine reductase QueH [Oscillospiraceae bacterium]
MLNYQIKLEEQIKEAGSGKKLLLHACCAPCSSYVLEYLSEFFDITLLYFNPNISPEAEYRKRIAEVERLLREMPLKSEVGLLEGRYCPEEFFKIAEGLEELPEGGERCFKCYRQRLEEAAKAAKDGGFDYFTTTLSISPHKNAEKLNLIGEELEKEYGVKYLYGDFKKRNGYKRSIELSRIYGLYRQNYCGCIYSRRAAEQNKI